MIRRALWSALLGLLNKIIQTTSYNDLVQRMRIKQDALASADQGRSRKASSVKP